MIKTYICLNDPSASVCSLTQVCAEDEAKFEVVFALNNYSEQTSWKLIDECTGKVVHAQEAYSNNDSESDLFITCIPRGTYMFGLSDSNGDGLTSSAGGSVTVNYDGGEFEVQIEGEEIGSFVNATFGDEGATSCAPTMSPTTLVCSDDEAKFEIDITFDDYSEQTFWGLLDECTEEVVLLQTYVSGETSDFYSTCIPRGRYIFVLGDFNSDGISPPGSVTVNYDGGEFEFQIEGEDFEYYTSSTFGEEGATCVPTMSPTPLVCSDNETTFEVDITFDDYSSEISWVLVYACTGEQVLALAYDYGETSDLYYTCIPRGRYIFQISDSYGDGLSLPGGNVTVNYDGGSYELEVKDNFGSSASAKFGEGATCAPMMAPTSSPTLSPTSLECSDDEALFEVNITFDDYSEHTYWGLFDQCNEQLVLNSTYMNGEASDFYSTCIPRGRYIFVLGDFNSDGISPPGSVTVNYDGGEFEFQIEGEDFEYYTSSTFGEEGATCVPTMSPTPLVCSDNETTFEVDITFDDYSSEISWVLVYACTGEQVLALAYDYGETSDLYYTCIPRGRYIFQISDSYGDGLSLPGGNVTVNYDGGSYELEVKDNFGSSASAKFGEGATCAPMMAPTSSPTLSPTSLECSDDEALFEVNITFDDYSEHTYWGLFDQCNEQLVLNSTYMNGEASDFYSTCIPRGRYIFVLGDWVGNGISSPGSVSVNYDGGEYDFLDIEGEDFDDGYTSATFGEGPTCAPTMSPTPLVCSNDDEMKVSVIVRADGFPSAENNWTIADPDKIVLASNNGPFVFNEVHHQAMCLSKTCGSGGNYTFTIMDFDGDGILNPGYYKVLVDGVRVDSGSDALNFYVRSIEINGCPSAPPPLSPCTDYEVEVALELQTDKFHSETSFEIRHAESDAIVVAMTKPPLPQRIMRESYCLEKLSGINDGVDYLFHIHDAGGDGLKDEGMDWELSGHFKLFVDGELVRGDSDGTNFGFMDTVVIDTSVPPILSEIIISSSSTKVVPFTLSWLGMILLVPCLTLL